MEGIEIMKKNIKTKMALFMLFACTAHLSFAPEVVKGPFDASGDSWSNRNQNRQTVRAEPNQSLMSRAYDRLFGPKVSDESENEDLSNQFSTYDENKSYEGIELNPSYNPKIPETKTFTEQVADRIAQWKKTNFDRLSFNKMWEKIKSQAQSIKDLMSTKEAVDESGLSKQD